MAKNIDLQLSEVTKAQLDALISGSQLSVGMGYKITDRGDRGITLTGISSNQLSLEGRRTMLCPKSYSVGSLDGNSWKGVWHSTKTVVVNDLMIWGGLVWKNLTGSIGSATTNREAELDATNWALISKASFSNSEYVEMVFTVHYDIEHDWISKQFDDNGNELGCSYEHYTKFDLASKIGSVNPVDICDWNYQSYGSNVSISNNKCIAVINNVEGVTIHGNTISMGFIRRNKMTTYIANNTVINSTVSTGFGSLLNSLSLNTCSSSIVGNVVIGTIDSNSCATIFKNNSGTINANYGSTAIYSNTVIGGISNNSVSSGIFDNISNDSISGNVVTGSIWSNECVQGIYNNNGVIGDIFYNSCFSINNNNGTGSINHNRNNGVIQGCSLNGHSIYNNVNNGDIIAGTLSSDITDVIVNK
jgi:hypothetical protein